MECQFYGQVPILWQDMATFTLAYRFHLVQIMPIENRRTWTLTAVLALVCLLLTGPSPAQRVEGEHARADSLYAAEVSVRSQNESERRVGFARALALVLDKLSGTQNSSKRPGVSQELRQAERYVAHFDYRQDEHIGASGTPSHATMLVVHFRPSDVDAIAAAMGLPIWPEPRPKPVLWLAIHDGRSSAPRLVGLQQNNAVRPLLDRAIARGYRLGLPMGDDAEQAAVDAIWNGDTAAIAHLSKRYNPPMQLIGKLYRSDEDWTAEWTLVDNGHVLVHENRRNPDARQAMSSGADIAADVLARRNARPVPGARPTVQRVAFSGINTSTDYTRLSALLQQMAVVRGFRPVLAMPGRLEVELDLISGLPGFQRSLGETGLIAVDAASDMPTFQLR